SKRAVHHAALERPVRILALEQPVDEAGREGIAATDAIENLDVLLWHLVELPLVVTDRAPGVDACAPGRSQRRRHGCDVRKRVEDAADHLAEARGRELAETFIDTLQRKSKRRREVLLVAEEHVDIRHQRAVDLLRPLASADRPP